MFFNKTKKILEQTELTLLQCQTDLYNTQNALSVCQQDLEKTNKTLFEAQTETGQLKLRYAPIIAQESALKEITGKIEQSNNHLILLQQKYQNGLFIYTALEKEINLYNDSLEIGTFGLYEPQYNFINSEQFKVALLENYEKQKKLIKDDLAAICNTEWSIGGSKAEGRKMTNQYKKLMLFAFNGECDSSITKVKWNNAGKTKERIEKSFENINKLGQTQNVHLSQQLLTLKIEELSLTHEYELKLHAEKEEQRRIKEQMREEEKAQRDFERAEQEAADEERKFQKSLDKARVELSTASVQNTEALTHQIAILEQKLQEAHEKKERAISMAQQTKVGHIYVISNIGSFGEDVYKIGMTRRLDPMDRIRELGDASVPFHFDIHAIIYSENAPQLEYEIHQKFNDRRLNRINGRREFFHVTLSEIEEVVKLHYNAEITFTQVAEAKEFRETMTMIEKLKEAVVNEIPVSKFPTSFIDIK